MLLTQKINVYFFVIRLFKWAYLFIIISHNMCVCVYIYFLEKERKGKKEVRNMDGRNTNRLPPVRALTRNRPGNLLVPRTMPNQLSHINRAQENILEEVVFSLKSKGLMSVN